MDLLSREEMPAHLFISLRHEHTNTIRRNHIHLTTALSACLGLVHKGCFCFLYIAFIHHRSQFLEKALILIRSFGVPRLEPLEELVALHLTVIMYTVTYKLLYELLRKLSFGIRKETVHLLYLYY